MTLTPLTPRPARPAGGSPPARPARAAVTALVALAVAAGTACSDSELTDVRRDGQAPTLAIARADAPDTAVAFSVNVSDQLGIKYVDVFVSGAVEASFADTIRTAQTTFTRNYSVPVPRSVPAGSAIRVVAEAVDGAGNRSSADTLDLAAGNVAPPAILITSPASGSVAVSGKNVLLGISARSGLKVRVVGFEVSGAFTASDSSTLATPLRDSVAVIDTLVVPANVTGNATVTPFVIDSLGQRVRGSGVALTVQSASSVSSAPVVSFGLTSRIETTDTIQVSASDVTGITALGYEVRDTAGTLLATDSATSDGKTTPLFKTFSMRLPVGTFPTRVFVRAFARNGDNTKTRAFAGGATPRVDSALVVAGTTRALPNGGRVADVYYHSPKDRLYLSNIDRNRVEVFNVADSSFKRAIDVGSRPWGLTPWPRDRSGNVGDTLLVANSGGTSVTYVNLNGGADGTGREVYRYGLPNIIVYAIKTQASALVPGQVDQVKTMYDFSDRPQFIAATCQGATAPGTPCGDVLLTYSTLPTAGQPSPFVNRGTVRWENLNKRSSHFFFEQATDISSTVFDSLEIRRFAAKDGGGTFVGSDSILVPFQQPTSRAGEFYSVQFELDKIGFRDTTFVRSSGNFRRAVMGEGGLVTNARAIMYDVTAGLEPETQPGSGVRLTTPVIDRGVSRARDVSDFIANTSQNVFGAAINFDGELAAIRGNASTALIGSTLRLQGLMSTTAANPGFDFHPLNTGTNSSPATRLAFAASAEPQIEIYDTYCYQRVATIPVRDPIIGPIKSARRTNGQLVLIGATARGIVTANLADSFATTCQQP